jgi:hypothetical protein
VADDYRRKVGAVFPPVLNVLIDRSVRNEKSPARSFQELNAGELAPLDQALPELRGVVLSGGVGQGWATTSRNSEKNWRPQGASKHC